MLMHHSVCSHVARLPDDDLLRATTQPGTTEAPIRITHLLKISMEFTTGLANFRRLLALSVERPMNMSSVSHFFAQSPLHLLMLMDTLSVAACLNPCFCRLTAMCQRARRQL